MQISRREVVTAGSLALATSAAAASASTVAEEPAATALGEIRQIDYAVIFCRDMAVMRHFYGTVLGFVVNRELGEGWVEYRIGSNILALTVYGMMFNDTPPEKGALALQLAFRVAPGTVARCAAELEKKGVAILHPVTDQPWGHRTLFFRDPDGNVIEIFAEI